MSKSIIHNIKARLGRVKPSVVSQTPDVQSDWQAILSNSQPQWQTALENAKNGSNILIAMNDGKFTPGTIFHSLLGTALTLRGAKVQFLLCDGVLPACTMAQIQGIADITLAINGPSYLCEQCFGQGQAAFEPLGLSLLRFSSLITDEDQRWAQALAQQIPFSEIDNYTLDGISVGEHALAGCLRFFAVGNLEGERLAEPILRRYFYGALLTVALSRRLFSGAEYSTVVISDGIYVPHGVIAEVARQLNIHVVTWNVGLRKGTFIASHHDNSHRAILTEPTSKWENIPWTEEREAMILNYLASRAQGGSADWFSVNKTPLEDMAAIESELGIDLTRPTVGLLTNVMWDAQVIYKALAFPNMLEWVLETIRYFGQRPDVQLLIRVHPGEVRANPKSRQPIAEEIRKAFPGLPSNIKIIPAESTISTYSVMTRCNAVLIFGTKAGFELAALGIPIIIAGSAQLRGKGVAWEASSGKEYFSLLDQLPFPGRMEEGKIRRARMFSYYFFFQRMISIKSLQPQSDWPLYRLQLSHLNELLPGVDAGLDILCDGILTGSDFIARQVN